MEIAQPNKYNQTGAGGMTGKKGNIMKRTTYKGYIIDHDGLGRLYIYNAASPASEDNDKKLVTDFYGKSQKRMTDLQAAKMAIDESVEQNKIAAESRNEVKRSVGQNIRKNRTDIGMTQTDLAKNIGTTQQQIARYETGEQDLTVSRLREIAEALHIDPAYLL